jgi:hypothetical protein
LRNAAGNATALAGTGATTATTAAITASPAIAAPSLEVGFHLAPLGHGPAHEVSEVLGRVSQIRKLTPIAVSMQGDTVILRGTVATEHDRGLAEDIARLQPGVWNVHNELTVAGPPAARSVGSLTR